MEDNNRRIVKNTIYLYFRQIIILALAFVSTRIVLSKLGIDDYGIYVLVGGFVTMFTVLNNVLQSATRRFMAIAIGKGNEDIIHKTYSTSLTMHILIGLLVVILLETIGLWVLNTHLHINPERIRAANWVFQISVFNVFITITQTPFVATVTAHEKFDIYAYLSIYDILGKILILFLLVCISGDKLIIYALLMSSVSLTGAMIYRYYCRIKFLECKTLSLKIDHALFKEMIIFSGWDSLGNIMSVLNAQGTTVLLNTFLTTAVNAARGLAGTVTSTIANFVTGFVTASEPQLAKYYAQKDMLRFENLIFSITQLTLFLLAIFAVPVFCEIDFVLKLWLNKVPDFTADFIKITIFVCFLQYSYTMLIKGIVAIGRVKEYNVLSITLALTNLPLVWLVLWLGWTPNAVYWVSSIPSLLNFCITLHILHEFENFPIKTYITKIFIKNILLVLVASILPFIVSEHMEEGWIRFMIVCCLSVVSTVTIMWRFALNKEIRDMVHRKVLTILHLKNAQTENIHNRSRL